MKRLLRHPWATRLVAALMAAYVQLCLRTARCTVQGQGHHDAALTYPGGVVVCFWHAGVLLSPACWDNRRRPGHILISQSRDGDAVARMAQRLGFVTIRGSSLKKTATDKAKGSLRAFRDMLRLLQQDKVLAITPDGPRGPAHTVQDGAVRLAATAQAPVMCVGLAMAPAWRLNTWDGLIIPRPFARACRVYGPLIAPPHDTEDLRAVLAAHLHAAQTQAEAEVAR